MSPTEFKRGAPHRDVWFALDRSCLGFVLVARTERGICAVHLGDSPESLLDGLRSRFSKARLDYGDSELGDLVTRVVRHLEQPADPPDLPLDIQGTAFQRKVWQMLQTVPPGSTCTYSDLAGRLGKPQAVRAVANACGRNEIAVLIPCHRVVGRDGRLRGYRWGLERKRQLLELEARTER